MGVTAEKGSLLAVATLLISIGAAKCVEDDLMSGVILIVLGLAILFVREYLKLHRWHSVSLWRGEKLRV